MYCNSFQRAQNHHHHHHWHFVNCSAPYKTLPNSVAHNCQPTYKCSHNTTICCVVENTFCRNTTYCCVVTCHNTTICCVVTHNTFSTTQFQVSFYNTVLYVAQRQILNQLEIRKVLLITAIIPSVLDTICTVNHYSYIFFKVGAFSFHSTSVTK